MFTKYAFEKTQDIYETTEVFQICEICKTLFPVKLLQNKTQRCCSCLKRENSDFYLYSIKSIIHKNFTDLGLRKSWWFYENVEKKLINASCDNLFFDYCHNNLYWYIKKPTDQIHFCAQIIQTIEHLLKDLFQFSNFKPSSTDDILNAFSQKNRFINTDFCEDATDTTSFPDSYWVINRKMLQKKIDTNVAFFTFD